MVTLKKEGKDKIGVTNPFYTYHEKQVMEITGKRPYYLPLEKNEDWTPNFEKLEEFMKEGLNALIVINFFYFLSQLIFFLGLQSWKSIWGSFDQGATHQIC